MSELDPVSFALGWLFAISSLVVAAVINQARNRAVHEQFKREVAERAWRRHAPK